MIILKLFSFFLAGVALLNIWNDQSKEPLIKIAWSLGVLMIPVIGPLAWIFIGRK